jgi:uncharacterized protein YvpB
MRYFINLCFLILLGVSINLVQESFTKASPGVNDPAIEANIVFLINSNLAAVHDEIKSVNPPFIDRGLSYVPLRFIGESLGAKVTWQDAMQTISMQKGETQIDFKQDLSPVSVNGQMSKSPAPVQMKQGIAYAPLRAIAEAFHQQISFDKGFVSFSAAKLNSLQAPPISQQYTKLTEGYPYIVYQGEKPIQSYGQLDEAIAAAGAWSHASVRERDGDWVWDNYLPFRVYQKENFMKDWDDYSEAVDYAKQFANSTINYHSVKQPVWSNSASLKSSVFIDAPQVSQYPELARGCEVAALAMMLQHAGVDVNKMTLAEEIVKVNYYGSPHEGFVGDIYTFDNPGYGVYNEPIADLAEEYLPHRIVNMTGVDFDDLLYSLDHDKPVWVITNSQYAPLGPSEFSTLQTPSGEMQITWQEHAVLVVGYDEHYFYINDPAGAVQKVEKTPFVNAWVQMGRQAVTYA